ncbi:MAG: zinc metallopeptidase [Spirochaetaceae bacterium]|nr:zinc metallopeptidase [Spirochaetaceae bacterium]
MNNIFSLLFNSDFGMMILFGLSALLSVFAQFLVQSTFSKYSKIAVSRNMNGAEAAKVLMHLNDISDVGIQAVAGSLTDHYDPSAKMLRLSEPVYGARTISAVGVAAHETGHAIQHKVGYGPLVLRSTLVPVANIGSQAGPVLAIVGLAASIPLLTTIGIILFAGAVSFYLITLPVEFNASSRALKNLEANNLLTQEELKGAKKVLTAAALTYVASALTAVLNLLRLILQARNRRR